MAENENPDDTIALAEALGAMIAGAATELHLRGTIPKDRLKAAINQGIQRIRTGRNFTASQGRRDAIAAAIQRTAVI